MSTTVPSTSTDTMELAGQHLTLANSIGDVKYAVTKSVSDSERDVLKAVGDNTTDTVAAVDRAIFDVRQSIERNGQLNLSATERNGGDTRSTVERNGGDTRISVERSAAELRSLSNRNSSEILLSEKDVLQAVGRAEGVIIAKGLEETCQIKSRMDLLERIIERQASDNYASLRLQASENSAKILLDACQNQNALQKQIADSVCCIKERINSRADQTEAFDQQFGDNSSSRTTPISQN